MKEDAGIKKVKEAHKQGGTAAAIKAIIDNANAMLNEMESDLMAGKPIKDVFDAARGLLRDLADNAHRLL